MFSFLNFILILLLSYMFFRLIFILKKEKILNDIDMFYITSTPWEFNKEKKEILENKINNIEKYATFHILDLSEIILDHINDGKDINKYLINDLKEQREYWRDILRIINGDETDFIVKVLSSYIEDL